MYTRIGKIVAFIATALGIAGIVGSFLVAPDIYAPDFERGSFEQSTLWMRQASILVAMGALLGVLCEISVKLEKFFISSAKERARHDPD